MIINSVSNVNFKGTTYTKNNNEYKKTYIGRIVGTGVGIALAIAAVRVKKGVGNVGKFSQKFKPVLDRAADALAKNNKDLADSLRKFSEEGINALASTRLKGILKFVTPLVAAWAVVGGYIKGAIVDKVINAKRAGNADKETFAA